MGNFPAGVKLRVRMKCVHWQPKESRFVESGVWSAGLYPVRLVDILLAGCGGWSVLIYYEKKILLAD